MSKEDLLALLPALKELVVGLVPGALGAAVSVATQGAMTWTQRFIQLTVGIIVSYYAGELAAHFGASGVVKSGIGFTAGIGAFEVVKSLRASLGDWAREAPGDLWNALLKKFRLK